MKAIVKIQEITHDELVDLFSTALTGSPNLGADYDAQFYGNLPMDKKLKDVYFEDILATVLMNKGTIQILDLYSSGEDDFYGKFPHKYISRENDPEKEYNFDCMAYSVTLDDILSGIDTIEKANTLQYILDGGGDIWDASNLIQEIVFGEIIYG